MNIFPQDPDFTPGSVGFDSKDANGRPYDLLGRKAVGERLSELLERIDQPLVIALDGGWGSGKSHFLKLWTGAHRLENPGTAQTIYFDAFEHDYLDDPLISLVAAISKNQPEETGAKAALKFVQNAAVKLARPAARIALALATAGATEIAGAVVDEGIKAAGQSAEEAFDAFWKKEAGRIAAMDEFRKALQGLTAPKSDGEKPQKLVFIIDELDRCRPDYALTLLEIIKHFFAVPNVHFVLGTNLTALENSVKARYGHEIDATQYLQKFVQLTVQFPKQTRGAIGGASMDYFEEVVEDYKLPDYYAQEIRGLLQRLAIKRNVSLRDVQRLLTYATLLPASVGNLRGGFTTIISGVLFLRVVEPNLYHTIRNNNFDFTEIENALSLQKPADDIANEIERIAMLDWVAWWYAISGDLTGIPDDYHKYARKTFSDGRVIKWEYIERHLATAFDTYSLPGQA